MCVGSEMRLNLFLSLSRGTLSTCKRFSGGGFFIVYCSYIQYVLKPVEYGIWKGPLCFGPCPLLLWLLLLLLLLLACLLGLPN